MAKIVLIANGTLRPGINNIDDFVDVYDDDVFLGSAYDTFTIINAPGVLAETIKADVRANSVVEDHVTQTYRLSKYPIRMNFTPAQLAILENVPGDIATKVQTILDGITPNA